MTRHSKKNIHNVNLPHVKRRATFPWQQMPIWQNKESITEGKGKITVRELDRSPEALFRVWGVRPELYSGELLVRRHRRERRHEVPAETRHQFRVVGVVAVVDADVVERTVVPGFEIQNLESEECWTGRLHYDQNLTLFIQCWAVWFAFRGIQYMYCILL